jgi:ABC-2 type transport system ATP-binding protein
MININNLTKTYKDGTPALKGITLTLDKKISIVLGQNGAGKTTLLRILSTQLMPSSGKATILGYDVVKEAGRIRSQIVSIPQEAEVINFLTAYEHMEIYLTARGFPKGEIEPKSYAALRKVGLYDKRDKMSYSLSGGMKRKVFVAMALAADAGLTFLDEPTRGLDPISRLEVWSAINGLKGKVVLTTHYLEEAKRLSDEIILMDSGKISMQGTTEALLRPMKGLMRVDGLKKGRLHVRIGSLDISYLRVRDAMAYAEKGLEVRQPDLEDLFIMGRINER